MFCFFFIFFSIFFFFFQAEDGIRDRDVTGGSDVCSSDLTLFYRPEAIHLGDLLRIWVRADATPPYVPQSDFQGSTRHPWIQRELLDSLPRPKPILSSKEFQGLSGLCRKDNSSQGSSRRLRLISRCRVRYEGPDGSAIRLRNKDLIPFRM